jgi:hypothetical protein
MRSRVSQFRDARAAIATASLVVAMTACSTGGGLFGRADETDQRAVARNDASPTVGATPLNAEGLAVYLEMMRVLIEGDALTRTETWRSVSDAAEFAPTTTNRLKAALASSVPGHPGSDAAQAVRRLSGLLSAGDALLPEERVLALVQLRDVEQRLILETTAQQLRTEMSAAIEQQDAEASARLQSLLNENQRLQSALDEATEKLDEITSIEQSIRERENVTE